MITEVEARQKAKCICGADKTPGAIVCWTCFKYRNDLMPLKYYPGTFEAWQMEFSDIIATTTAAALIIEEAAQGKGV